MNTFDFYTIKAGSARIRPLKRAFPAARIDRLRDGVARYGNRAYPRYWYTADVSHVDNVWRDDTADRVDRAIADARALCGPDVRVSAHYHAAD